MIRAIGRYGIGYSGLASGFDAGIRARIVAGQVKSYAVENPGPEIPFRIEVFAYA